MSPTTTHVYIYINRCEHYMNSFEEWRLAYTQQDLVMLQSRHLRARLSQNKPIRSTYVASSHKVRLRAYKQPLINRS